VLLIALEIVGRVAVVYGVLLIALRVGGRRELAELSPMDLLTMLLISETVSDALTGEHDGLAGGLTAAVALIAISFLASWISFRSRRAERVISGDAAVLIADGQLDPEVRRKHHISDDVLGTALHEAGVLEVADVARAFIEPDGAITVVTWTDVAEAAEHRKRRSRPSKRRASRHPRVRVVPDPA